MSYGGGDPFEQLEFICEENEVSIIQSGNMVVGPVVIRLAIYNFETSEGVISILPEDKLERILNPIKISKFKKFLESNHIEGPLSWHLGASYG